VVGKPVTAKRHPPPVSIKRLGYNQYEHRLRARRHLLSSSDNGADSIREQYRTTNANINTVKGGAGDDSATPAARTATHAGLPI